MIQTQSPESDIDDTNTPIVKAIKDVREGSDKSRKVYSDQVLNAIHELLALDDACIENGLTYTPMAANDVKKLREFCNNQKSTKPSKSSKLSKPSKSFKPSTLIARLPASPARPARPTSRRGNASPSQVDMTKQRKECGDPYPSFNNPDVIVHLLETYDNDTASRNVLREAFVGLSSARRRVSFCPLMVKMQETRRIYIDDNELVHLLPYL